MNGHGRIASHLAARSQMTVSVEASRRSAAPGHVIDGGEPVIQRDAPLVLQPHPEIMDPALVVEPACAGLVAAAPV